LRDRRVDTGRTLGEASRLATASTLLLAITAALIAIGWALLAIALIAIRWTLLLLWWWPRCIRIRGRGARTYRLIFGAPPPAPAPALSSSGLATGFRRAGRVLGAAFAFIAVVTLGLGARAFGLAHDSGSCCASCATSASIASAGFAL
jgi:hypothetical protein